MANYELEIVTKSYRDLKFLIINDKKLTIFTKLQNLITDREYSSNFMFAYKYYNSIITNDIKESLWNKYFNIEKEYKRQFISFNESSDFKLVHNEGFVISNTYPEYFIIPKNISDRELASVVKYRLKGRVPGN